MKRKQLNRITFVCIKFFSIVIAVTITLLLSQKIMAQPYLDIVNLKYTNSPQAGLIQQNKNDIKIRYYGIGTNLPVQFKNKKDAVIFSPFFESRSVKTNNNNRQNYYSVALPVSLSKTITYTKWNFLFTGIVRMNDNSINTKKNAGWRSFYHQQQKK